MKSTSALLFATVAAAADYYGEYVSSTSSKVGYTTIHPGYGKHPITVTKQYQTIPTYIPDPTCTTSGTWSDYVWVSTVIKDYDGKDVTVTKTKQKITIYHTSKTVSHTSTITDYGYAAPTGYASYPKNETTHTKVWTELYEKVHEAEYAELGPKALPGYEGSGLYEEWDDESETNYQPYDVKEFYDGKWKYYEAVETYAPPKPAVKTYDAPGTYTIPAYDVTVTKTTTIAEEASYTAAAGETCTYGGYTTEVTKPATITHGYGAYETEGHKTKTVIKYTTVTYDAPGTYTIVKPTITVYKTKTIITYPTASVYEPGVYHHDEETATITKPGQTYTCGHPKPPTSTPAPYPTSSSVIYTPYPTETPSPYPTETPSATTPYGPDPSADYEAAEEYGTPTGGYVKRGGLLERRGSSAKKGPAPGKRVVLV